MSDNYLTCISVKSALTQDPTRGRGVLDACVLSTDLSVKGLQAEVYLESWLVPGNDWVRTQHFCFLLTCLSLSTCWVLREATDLGGFAFVRLKAFLLKDFFYVCGLL